MPLFERMKQRWGVGPWGVLAILLAFSLAGLTTVRLKAPIIGLFMPATAESVPPVVESQRQR